MSCPLESDTVVTRQDLIDPLMDLASSDGFFNRALEALVEGSTRHPQHRTQDSSTQIDGVRTNVRYVIEVALAVAVLTLVLWVAFLDYGQGSSRPHPLDRAPTLPSRVLDGMGKMPRTIEQYNETALATINAGRRKVGLPPVKIDNLETHAGLAEARKASQELQALIGADTMPPGPFAGRENQIRAALAQLAALQEGGQTNLFPAEQENQVGSGFLNLLNRGVPEGARSGVDALGGGALDDLLEVGGSTVFNLLADLAKKNVLNKEQIDAGALQKVGINDLIKALQAAQAPPGTVGEARNFSGIS
jgi:hypothetical protein